MAGWSDHPLLKARRREFLGAPMHALTMAETLALATSAMAERQPLHDFHPKPAVGRRRRREALEQLQHHAEQHEDEAERQQHAGD